MNLRIHRKYPRENCATNDMQMGIIISKPRHYSKLTVSPQPSQVIKLKEQQNWSIECLELQAFKYRSRSTCDAANNKDFS